LAVTAEILNLGIGAPNQDFGVCPDPTPDAVLRIQRLRDIKHAACTHANSTIPWDYWPQTLYDAREGSLRDTASTGPMTMGGIMQYIALDVGNLKKWIAGTTGTTGTDIYNNNGYIVYFSDRRGNHSDVGPDFAETGEYGFEDHINPTTAAGTPDGVLQNGENVNGPVNTTQELYGRVPSSVPGNIPAGSIAPYNAVLSTTTTNGSSPWRILPDAGQARVNKVVLFRRALKVVNGGINSGVNNLPTAGLTIVAENPVYVQGNYNATNSVTTEPNVPSAIIGDAITLLSNNWSDAFTFEFPNDAMSRDASTTGYRFAAMGGKGLSFNHCGAACGNPGDLYGTDGGAANFLRLLEDWGAATAGGGLNYRGSLVSLHTNRQAIGAYKFISAHVYNGGLRNFNFDTDFLLPALLPPGTPMFRDINTLTFRQILRPTE
jgi:hypothetical protein